MLGKTTREAFPEPTADRFMELFERVYATGETVTGTEVPRAVRSSDGSRDETVHERHVPAAARRGRTDRLRGQFRGRRHRAGQRPQSRRAPDRGAARERGALPQLRQPEHRGHLAHRARASRSRSTRPRTSSWRRSTAARTWPSATTRWRRCTGYARGGAARRQAPARAARPGRSAEHRVPARVHRERVSAGGGRVPPARAATGGCGCSAAAWWAWSRTAGCGGPGARSATSPRRSRPASRPRPATAPRTSSWPCSATSCAIRSRRSSPRSS